MEHDEDSGAEGAPDQSREQALRTAMDDLAGDTHGLAPVAGAIRKEQLVPLRAALEKIAEQGAGDAAIRPDIAALYVRCAALAIAAGDEATAHRWLLDAQELAPEETHAQLAAAREHPERFRALSHGRMLFRTGEERAARKIWTGLAKGGSDAIAAAARDELSAPRALVGGAPALGNIWGFGAGFAGVRDEHPDGTYATTYCLTALFIPVFPIRAYRVYRQDDGWIVLAREQLSGFARQLRYVAVAALVMLVAGVALYQHYTDPDRRARARYEETLAEAATQSPEAAIKQLELLLASGEDSDRAGPVRRQLVGAEILKKTAELAPRPFLREHVDHGARLVLRYHSLPEAARGGPAREAAVDALERWRTELGTTAESAEERLALLRLAVEVADGPRAQGLMRQLTTLRLAVADAKVADWPLDALAILVDPLQAESMQRATKIVAELVEMPSLLVDAGAPLDKWLAVAAESDALRQAVVSQRELAIAGKAAAETADAAQLAAMEKQRPWDQFVQLRLAAADVDAGKLAAAADRLEKIGPPGLLVRDGQLMYAQIASALGKLEQADALLTQLLAGRLPGFLAAASKADQIVATMQERLWRELREGQIPAELEHKVAGVASDDEKSRLANEWVQEQIMKDPAFQQARERALAASDVVGVALAAGSVKLRRAQSMSGPERDAMLGAAERAFLAIRTAAEGQPEYQLGLGEIYARLGKTKESEAAFAAVLAQGDPNASLDVASVYRNLGNVARATQIATEIYDSKPAAASRAATSLAMLALDRGDEEAAETWYRKLDGADPQARIALADLEGRRLLDQGKWAECAAKFAQVAKWHMESGVGNYNNAALAHSKRFYCSGDLTAHADAEAALEKAYRAQPEHPIIVGNLVASLDEHSALRALAREIDVAALRADVAEVMGYLREGPERDAILAALTADRRAQRAATLLSQYEVLAPNRVEPYSYAFAAAQRRRDEAAALAVLERARRATLDTSGVAALREQEQSSTDDPKLRERFAARIARHDAALARRLDRKTRAVALLLRAADRQKLGWHTADGALIAQARTEALEAGKLWPALVTTPTVIATLIDEAAVAADSAAWRAVRGDRSAIGALAKLAADGAALAEKIRGSQQWTAVLGHARAETRRPTLEDLRLARLLGDAALETRAKVVLDDKLERARYEFYALLDPSSPATKEALATFDLR